jgi:hypothetical protein
MSWLAVLRCEVRPIPVRHNQEGVPFSSSWYPYSFTVHWIRSYNNDSTKLFLLDFLSFTSSSTFYLFHSFPSPASFRSVSPLLTFIVPLSSSPYFLLPYPSFILLLSSYSIHNLFLFFFYFEFSFPISPLPIPLSLSKFPTLTDLIYALPGQASVNTDQHSTIEEPVVSVSALTSRSGRWWSRDMRLMWWVSVPWLYKWQNSFGSETSQFSSGEVRSWRTVQEASLWRFNVWFEDFIFAVAQWYSESVI